MGCHRGKNQGKNGTSMLGKVYHLAGNLSMQNINFGRLFSLVANSHSAEAAPGAGQAAPAFY